MKLEIGKAYLTRDGRKAFIGNIDLNKTYGTSGCVVGNSDYMTWNMYGEYDTTTGNNKLDLISEYSEPSDKYQSRGKAGMSDCYKASDKLHFYVGTDEVKAYQKAKNEAMRAIINKFGEQIQNDSTSSILPDGKVVRQNETKPKKRVYVYTDGYSQVIKLVKFTEQLTHEKGLNYIGKITLESDDE